MEFYDATLSVQEGLNQLFGRFGFSPDAYTAKRFAIWVGKFPIWLPNSR